MEPPITRIALLSFNMLQFFASVSLSILADQLVSRSVVVVFI